MTKPNAPTLLMDAHALHCRCIESADVIDGHCVVLRVHLRAALAAHEAAEAGPRQQTVGEWAEEELVRVQRSVNAANGHCPGCAGLACLPGCRPNNHLRTLHPPCPGIGGQR